jgi:hypothetical protein
MDIFGLEARQSDLARGIVIVRCRAALTRAEQRAVWRVLSAAGITEDDSEEAAGEEDEPALRLLTAPWLPPLPEEIAAQRAGVERANDLHALEAVWFIKVETGIDGEVWQDLRATHLAEQRELAAEEIAAANAPPAEVLYSAPDAPLANLTVWQTGEPVLGEGTLMDPEDTGVLPGGARASGVSRAAVPEEEDGAGDEDTGPRRRGAAAGRREGGDDEEDEATDPDGDADDDDELDDDFDPDESASMIELLMAESHWRKIGRAHV